jgi:hypothetical protein
VEKVRHGFLAVAVGMPVTQHPPHKTVRASLTHTASTLDDWRRSVPSDKDAKHGERESIDPSAERIGGAEPGSAGHGVIALATTSSRAASGRDLAEASFPARRGIGNNR